jgi:hypothetical protein
MELTPKLFNFYFKSDFDRFSLLDSTWTFQPMFFKQILPSFYCFSKKKEPTTRMIDLYLFSIYFLWKIPVKWTTDVLTILQYSCCFKGMKETTSNFCNFYYISDFDGDSFLLWILYEISCQYFSNRFDLVLMVSSIKGVKEMNFEKSSGFEIKGYWVGSRHCSREINDTKGVLRNRKSKDMQYNCHKKRNKRINNDVLNTAQKTKDRSTRTLLKPGSERVSSSCSTCRTCRVTLVTNLVIVTDEERTVLWLRQTEQIHCHLWQIFRNG